VIFINYRRSDSYHVAKRLAESLGRDFGWENIFFDEATPSPGAEWPSEIKKAINTATAVVVVIGRKWLHAREKDGRRRIDNKRDWVRQEICTALSRKRMGENVLVIPALCERTSVPKQEDLDEELSLLCATSAVRLREVDGVVECIELRRVLIEHGFHLIFPPPVLTPLVKMPDQLTQEEEDAFLSEFNMWHIVREAKRDSPSDFIIELYRLYEFQSYEDAWRFMEEVDERGIRRYNHHPRWQNTYNRVEVWLSTFNIGHKPSKRDVRLARIFEEIWGEFEKERQVHAQSYH
jgi:pterin-4a-carbinolamine dehydratase